MKLTTTWNLTAMASGPTDPKFTKERTKILKKYTSFAKKWSVNSAYLKSSKVMREALDEYEKLSVIESEEGLYLFLASSLDAENTDIQAASILFRDFINKISDLTRFFELEIAQIPEDKQHKFLSSKHLTDYKNYIKGIFDSSRYLLSEKEERILSMKSGVSSSNWVDMIEEFISSETREVLVENKKKLVTKKQNFSEIMNLVRSKNDKVSETAIEAVKSILGKYAKVTEKEINSFLENKKINDELRGFERPDSSRHHAEGIDTQAVDTLVKVVSDNFKVSQDYYKLKAKLFGVKKFSYFQRVKEFGSVDTSYTYKQSVNIVTKALSRISDEFASIFKTFTVNHNIDVSPKKGKRGGAFCMPSYKSDVRLLLNFTSTTRDISTLAHEMGHGIHAMKARKEHALNYGVPMCTAEVASTFCEDFVIDELLNEVDEETKLLIMLSQVEDKVSTIFRQIAGYNFEKELHDRFRKEGYLPEKTIGKIFNKHMKSYMGNTITFDEHSGRGWIYWSHFRTPFYVFAYSMALLVAQFARRKFSEDAQYINNINEFYSTGSSLPPAEIFAKLGLDVHSSDQWQEGINEVKDLLSETKKLAKKLGKI